MPDTSIKKVQASALAGSEETWTSDGLSWLVVGRRGLDPRKRLTFKSSISTSPRCTLRRSDRQPRDGKRTDGRSSEGKRAHGMRTHGYRRYAHRRWFQLVSP